MVTLLMVLSQTQIRTVVLTGLTVYTRHLKL